MRSFPRALLALLLAGLFLGTGFAAACPVYRDPYAVPLLIDRTDVDLQLAEGYARMTIATAISNPSWVDREGEVLFPLRPGELITNLQLRIGEVTFNSSAWESENASDEFQEATEEDREASVVQYDSSRDVYWTRVRVPAGETRTTIVTLETLLRRVDGYNEYVARLAAHAEDTRGEVRLRLRVRTSTPLERIISPSHPDLAFPWTGDRAADAYLNLTRASEARDLVIRFWTAGTSISQYPSEGDARFVRFAMAGDDPVFDGARSATPRALLLLLDGSGSMGQAGRSAIVQRSLAGMLSVLGPAEVYAVAVIHGKETEFLSPTVQPWSRQMGDWVSRFLADQRPHGSTNLEAPLPLLERWADEARALGKQPAVVLMTDGGISSGGNASVVAKGYRRLAATRDLPVMVLGTESRSDDIVLLEDLAHLTGGVMVRSTQDPEADARQLLETIRVPVLQDVRVTFPDIEAEFATPNPQRVLRGEDVFVLARVDGNVSTPLRVELRWPNQAGLEELRALEYPATAIAQDPLVERSWVLGRTRLLIAAVEWGDSGALDDLRTFALENHLATPYTSLLVTLPGAEVRSGAVSESMPLWRWTSPIENEGRLQEALVRELNHRWLAEGEVDRFVEQRSPDYQPLASAGTAATVFSGTHLRLLRYDGELVGVTRGWLHRQDYAPKAAWLALAGITMALLVLSTYRDIWWNRGRRP